MATQRDTAYLAPCQISITVRHAELPSTKAEAQAQVSRLCAYRRHLQDQQAQGFEMETCELISAITMRINKIYELYL
jgi:hypothetical protein